MYDDKQSQRLLIETDLLLQRVDSYSDIDQAFVDRLIDVLIYHEWRYYVNNDPVITDYDYDRLFKKIQQLEKDFPKFNYDSSPTKRVAEGLNESFPTVEHLIPMLSLDNSYNADDLIDFDRKVKQELEEEKVIYAVEPKFDGSSIALVYENDRFVRAATRGNGSEGDDITANARMIRSIPLKINVSKYGIHKLEVRGEVVIELSAFAELNDKRIEENKVLKAANKKELELFKHARNTAAGALRMKDPSLVAERKLEAFIYQLGHAEDKKGNRVWPFKSHFDTIDWLGKLGFKIPTIEKGRFKEITEVADFCAKWEAKRDTYNYEIDGMVVKVDSLDSQDRIGNTSHHPKWAIAYKFKAKQAITKLERIDYQVGRTGAITPVAKLKPVILTGVEISRVSLHNEDFIVDRDLRIGDSVIVERAGDVIPYIVGPVVAKRNGKEKVITFISNCPSCDTMLTKEEDESAWKCTNINCPAQLEESIIHFVSKGAMNIDGLGRDIVIRFLKEGIITSVNDLYRLDYDAILNLEGWKERSVEKLKTNINKSKNNPIWRLLVGLGISMVGSSTAKMLSKQVDDIREFQNWSEERLAELEDIGPKVAHSISTYFTNSNNLQLLDELESLEVNLKTKEDAITDNKLEGKTFLFTGTLNKMGRNQAKELVESYGGKNLSSISAKLNYLVAGEKAGSKLTKAQKIDSIRIISEDDFLNFIENGLEDE